MYCSCTAAKNPNSPPRLSLLFQPTQPCCEEDTKCDARGFRCVPGPSQFLSFVYVISFSPGLSYWLQFIGFACAYYDNWIFKQARVKELPSRQATQSPLQQPLPLPHWHTWLPQAGGEKGGGGGGGCLFATLYWTLSWLGPCPLPASLVLVPKEKVGKEMVSSTAQAAHPVMQEATSLARSLPQGQPDRPQLAVCLPSSGTGIGAGYG